MKNSKNSFFTYRDRPLVRNGNTIYYGNMQDEFIIMMQILSEKKLDDLTLADKVLVQIMKTDPKIDPKDVIVKKSEKNSLYSAIEIANIWLDRALEQK